MAKVFFSYSHKDEALRNELEIHLSMLKRQGVIEAWHDRRIGAGQEFDREINHALDNADIILLLVSPYFLASDYCYDLELTRAMEHHESGKSQVIPVILHPCDWRSASFGKLLATPADGKPISKHPNQHDAFLDIVESIKQAVDGTTNSFLANSYESTPSLSPSIEKARILPRSSNLRVKKEFTEQQKDEFLDQTFEYVSNYFEGSLAELSKRIPEVSTKFKRIDANHFTSIIYVDGTSVSQCKIWLGGINHFSGGIAYSTDISSSDNSLNDSLRIDTDGHTLFFNAMGMSFMGMGNGEDQLSQEGAAEYFWERLMQPLQ